jgi:SAM-dependent methyltransferase
MHKTALDHAAAFFNTYGPAFERPVVVEVGSADVNGSLRSVAPRDCQYVGLDFAPGKGVDVVLTDPYRYPLESGFADVVVTSSCFEHAQFFWLSFLEILRILKPEGVVYVNVPSNGSYHRYPVDCWRFYPDAGLALSRWAQRNGLSTLLLESFIGFQDSEMWNDFVAVFLKDRTHASRYPQRMHQRVKNPTNVIVDEAEGPAQITQAPQDVRRVVYLANNMIQLINGLQNV